MRSIYKLTTIEIHPIIFHLLFIVLNLSALFFSLSF